MNIDSSYAIGAGVVRAIPRHGFPKARVLVVGDLMLDRYIIGEVDRISPEAPVPVLCIREEKTVAGGAANVAANITSLHAEAILAGVIGQDADGECLLEICTRKGISDFGVVRNIARPTTCKTRLMCSNHQIARMDREVCKDLEAEVSHQLRARVQAILNEGVHAVVISDYAKGVLTTGTLEWVIGLCASKDIPVLVDPKRPDYRAYSGATCITPNHKEFQSALIAMSIPADSIAVSGALLRDRLRCGTLLVTQGALGMTAISAKHSHHFPALAEEVFDVSGAGDTVIATIGTCLAGGFDIMTAIQIANVAASLVVRKAGVAQAEWEELYSTMIRYSDESGNSLARAEQAPNLRAV